MGSACLPNEFFAISLECARIVQKTRAWLPRGEAGLDHTGGDGLGAYDAAENKETRQTPHVILDCTPARQKTCHRRRCVKPDSDSLLGNGLVSVSDNATVSMLMFLSVGWWCGCVDKELVLRRCA